MTGFLATLTPEQQRRILDGWCDVNFGSEVVMSAKKPNLLPPWAKVAWQDEWDEIMWNNWWGGMSFAAFARTFNCPAAIVKLRALAMGFAHAG